MSRRLVRFISNITLLFGLGLLAWMGLFWLGTHLPPLLALALLLVGVGAALGALVGE